MSTRTPGFGGRLLKAFKREWKPSSDKPERTPSSDPEPAGQLEQAPVDLDRAFEHESSAQSQITSTVTSSTPRTPTTTTGSPTSRRDGGSGASIKDSFMKMKGSFAGLPSFSWLLAEVLGICEEFEEVQSVNEDVHRMVTELNQFAAILNELHAAADSGSDVRSRLEDIDKCIKQQQIALSRHLNELRGAGPLDRTAITRTVTKDLGRIISHVHAEVLLLHSHILKRVMVRDDISLKEALRPVDMSPIFANQEIGCMPGTRTAILDRLLAWAKDPAGPRVFWMSGMAGIGKTAIAQTFCDLLDSSNIFAPRFFCSRRTSVEAHQDVCRILPTLAMLMARKYPKYKSALVNELRSLGPDRDPLSLPIKEQFRALLGAPLSGSDFKEGLPDTVIVVDALDELKEPHLVGELIGVLLSEALSVPLKIFLTSRPDDPIRLRLGKQTSSLHGVLRLHDVEENIVKEDIKLYLTARLHFIASSVIEEPPDSEPWPTEAQINRLATLADKLFLYAATIVKYLMDENPRRRLETLLNAQSTIATASLDDTYRFILGTAFPARKLEPTERVERKRCLAALMLAREPMSLEDMAQLLDLKTSDVRAAFRPLHSVIQVPFLLTEPLSTFHASLPEYLTSETRSGCEIWHVSAAETHSDLAKCCLRIMTNLRFNITESRSSFLANTDERQGTCVPRTLRYGCQHGLEHLIWSRPLASALVSSAECLQKKFLYWLEVLTVLGMVNEASSLIRNVITAIDSEETFRRPDIRDFMLDASVFIIRFQEPLSLSAPHIYISSLPFTEPDSKIVQLFRSQFPGMLRVRDSTHVQSQYPALVLRNPRSPVISAAVSPRSSLIAAGTSVGMIHIWNSKTGNEICPSLTNHVDAVCTLSFSPDEARLASGSEDGTIAVWNTESWNQVCQPLKGHPSKAEAGQSCVVAWLDSIRLVSGYDDGTIRIWNTTMGVEVCKPIQGHSETVASLAISPSSKYVASLSTALNRFRIWDVQTRKEVFAQTTEYPTSIAFSSDGTRFACGYWGGMIHIRDTRTWEARKCIEGHTGSVTSVAFSTDSARLISGSADKTIRVWNSETGGQLCEPIDNHTSSFEYVTFTPDSSRIISGSWKGDHAIRVWNVNPDEQRAQHHEGNMGEVTCVAVSYDSKHIVSASLDKTIRIWDAYTGREVYGPLSGHSDGVFSVAFSSDSTRVVSGSRDRTVRIWDVKAGKECKRFEGHTRGVSSVVFSPDSTIIASASQDHTIRLWDSETGKALGDPFKGHMWDVNTAAFSPNGDRIASGSGDKTVRIWDVSTGQEVIEALNTRHTGSVCSVNFSLDSTCIVSGGDDLTLVVWDARTGEAVVEFPISNTGGITSTAFSPDSTTVIASYRDGKIRIWDTRTGRMLCEPLTGHTSKISSVVFMPNATRLVSGSYDRTIRVWDAKSHVRREPDETMISPGFASSVESSAFMPNNFRPSEDWQSSGWAVSFSGERLFWVPPEFRRGFYWPRTELVIGARLCRLDLTNFARGEEWTKCYAGP